MVPAAVGTDTGGSIRFPAASCGLVGLKPTYGRVSRRGVHPNTFSIDACGPMARTVEDCAILLGAMAGHDARDPGSIDEPVADYRAALTGDIRGVRVGLVRHWYAGVATAEVEAAVDAAAERLREQGATVEEATLDPLQDYVDCKTVIAISELYAVHERDLKRRPQDFGASLRSMVMAGALLLADDYIQALRWRAELASRLLAQFARFDVLATAGWLSEADAYRPGEVGAVHSRPPVTMPFNVAGNPAINVPCGFTSEGLPLSLQIAGKPFDEATVLRVADAYERASGWRDRPPPLIASEYA
jgi:aspartyl-tRNA(Asn)/glutamyl-tRNA(Gln) amidotransferase subunit A